MSRAIDRRSLLLAAAGVALAACSAGRDRITAPPLADDGARAPDDTVPADSDVRSVAMVGDSITVGSRDELAYALAGTGLEVRAIDAQEGRRIAVPDGDLLSGVEAARAVAATTPPDLWVVALGTNDADKYEPAEVPAVVTELLAALPTDAPLVWVDTYLAAEPDRSAAFNSELIGVLAGRARTVVAPWSAVAAGDGVLADGIHPSVVGRGRFAEVVAEAVTTLTG